MHGWQAIWPTDFGCRFQKNSIFPGLTASPAARGDDAVATDRKCDTFVFINGTDCDAQTCFATMLSLKTLSEQAIAPKGFLGLYQSI